MVITGAAEDYRAAYAEKRYESIRRGHPTNQERFLVPVKDRWLKEKYEGGASFRFSREKRTDGSRVNSTVGHWQGVLRLETTGAKIRRFIEKRGLWPVAGVELRTKGNFQGANLMPRLESRIPRRRQVGTV